jgi:hypothetical protein
VNQQGVVYSHANHEYDKGSVECSGEAFVSNHRVDAPVRSNALVQRRAAQRTVRCNRLFGGASAGQTVAGVMGLPVKIIR